MRLRELILPGILLAEIIFCFLFGDFVPLQLKSLTLAISTTLKDLLITVLPFIIFTFVISSMSELKQGAFSFVILAFLMVVTSNFISTSLAGALGELALQEIQLTEHITSQQELSPLWTFTLPKLISNDVALFFGMGCGILLSLSQSQKLRNVSNKLHQVANLFLKKVFIPLLPVFILGFIFKIEYEGMLENIFANYFTIFLLIVTFAFTYIIFLYGLATGFNGVKWINSLKNMMPAMITGFSTMSSASALPLIIDGTEKNTGNSLVRGVVPICVNIHLIGDCFSLSILALAILVSFGYPLPSLTEYLMFTTFFVLAKFAVAAVPGGGVLVMLPILEKYLGFNGEMLSLITLLYILFDPIITSANVAGNGAFSILYIRVYRAIGFSRDEEAAEPLKSI